MEEESGCDGQELVPKANAASVLWQYFGFRRDDLLQTEVICRTCKSLVKRTTGNTTNLRSHLEHHHKDLFQEFLNKLNDSQAPKKASGKKVTQTSVQQSFASVTPYEKTSKRYKEITEAITYCLAKDMMPMRTVEKPGFVHLVNKLDRRYEIPSRKYFSQEAIPNLYNTLTSEVKSELSQVKYFASTTDLWSSRTTEPYMSFTVHFITEDFEMKARCLETMYFPESHTGENIAKALREVLARWGLDEKQQICITTDNGANVVKAVVQDNGWMRLQCFGHRLHLAIGKC